MKKFVAIVIFICTLLLESNGQVQFIPGSYSTAMAAGSGAPGLPTLDYTPLAGTDRLLIFVLSYERDHNGAKGSNWADPNSVGGASPTVTFGGANMTKLRAAIYYQYSGAKAVGNATMTIELIIYGMLEANIPAGLNTFVVSGINNPGHSGDEAVMSAMMFENVMGVNYLGSNGCENCNSIAVAGSDPLNVNNMILSVIGAGSDRDISAGPGNTLVASTKNTNAAGSFGKFNENDGMALGAQYVTGTTALQDADFTLSGAADVFGNVEVAFRLVSPIVLPVELLAFDGKTNENDNTIFWTTASEINNDHFEIERSSDGFDWFKVGQVAGLGNSLATSNYEFVDVDAKCKNCYYRLKQVDFDGTFEYSPVIVLKMNRTRKFNIFPNPATDYINIDVSEGAEAIQIFDAAGKLIETVQVGEDFQYQINVNSLNSGHYYIMVKYPTSTKMQRLVKL